MRLDLPEQKALVFELDQPVDWGDMDALGHVNNTVYFRYMENARVTWLRSLGAQLEATREGPVIVNTFCDFLRQLSWPGTVRSRLYAGQPGRSSVDLFVTMERTDEPGQLVAAGGATLVWAVAAEQRSVPLPDFVRQAIAAGVPG